MFSGSKQIAKASFCRTKPPGKAPVTSFAMARKNDQKKQHQKDKKTKKENNNNKKRSSGAVIPRYRLWTKSILAPYPGENGNPLYSGDLEPDEFLGDKRIAQNLHPGNSEWLARPGMAICLSAAALRAGIREIAQGPPEAVLHLENFIKNTPTFKNAVKVLDVGKAKVPEKKDVKNAVSELVESFASISTQEREGLCQLAVYAAKLFLFSMHCLEAMDLLCNPKIYAKKMSRMPKAKYIQEEIEDWIRRPHDQARMKDMLTRALLAKIKTHQKEGQAQKQDKKRRKKSTSTASRTKSSNSESMLRAQDKSSSSSTGTKRQSSKSGSCANQSSAASKRSSSESEKKEQKQKSRENKRDRKNKMRQENDEKDKEESSKATSSPVT